MNIKKDGISTSSERTLNEFQEYKIKSKMQRKKTENEMAKPEQIRCPNPRKKKKPNLTFI